MRDGINFENTAIVMKGLRVTAIFLKEEITIVLILERDESVTHKMSEVEKETVIRGEMLVEDNSAVVEEVHPLR